MTKKIIANGNNVKTELLNLIKSIIEENGWTQKDAANALELTQSKVSLIVNLKIREFSLEKVLKLVSMLNYEVEIVARKTTNLNVN
ncbi:MAG: hypothetical protein PG981_000300 [Wolbachia endosymbiont of Ctenocephalides orientis wCori]|nr:MAG: hypothetical protein PG981_000300 [Wolbachia endosymbiont of Ctenocephalides orientis wCori]